MSCVSRIVSSVFYSARANKRILLALHPFIHISGVLQPPWKKNLVTYFPTINFPKFSFVNAVAGHYYFLYNVLSSPLTKPIAVTSKYTLLMHSVIVSLSLKKWWKYNVHKCVESRVPLLQLVFPYMGIWTLCTSCFLISFLLGTCTTKKIS